VSPRIWGLGDAQKTCIFRGLGAAVNHHSVAASTNMLLIFVRNFLEIVHVSEIYGRVVQLLSN